MKYMKPDFIFETSWEVCNKIGGIYTVISTKAPSLVEEFGDCYIMIGPEILRDTGDNAGFIEDHELYALWHENAESEGLKFRIGRWDIATNPVVILVDFTTYFEKKDVIFAEFWETYKLDSLSGDWDYIEPVLFGYAAAKIIESFYEFHLSSEDKIIAHFHEWMTGSGILYLEKYVPQAATIFTTHATATGRSIAGNGFPLYKDIAGYNALQFARDHGFQSKFSLEKTAAHVADCFTTVSDITSLECDHFLDKKVNLVTPNGFDDSFVPGQDEFGEKREVARKKVIEVAGGLLNQRIDEDSFLIISSGRYEFRNKGIDLFID